MVAWVNVPRHSETFANRRIFSQLNSKTWCLNTFIQQLLMSHSKITTEVDYFITKEVLSIDTAAFVWWSQYHSWYNKGAAWPGGRCGWIDSLLEPHIHLSNFYSALPRFTLPLIWVFSTKSMPASVSSPTLSTHSLLVGQVEDAVHDGVHSGRPGCEHRSLPVRGELLRFLFMLLFYFDYFFSPLENFVQLPLFLLTSCDKSIDCTSQF